MSSNTAGDGFQSISGFYVIIFLTRAWKAENGLDAPDEGGGESTLTLRGLEKSR